MTRPRCDDRLAPAPDPRASAQARLVSVDASSAGTAGARRPLGFGLAQEILAELRRCARGGGPAPAPRRSWSPRLRLGIVAAALLVAAAGPAAAEEGAPHAPEPGLSAAAPDPEAPDAAVAPAEAEPAEEAEAAPEEAEPAEAEAVPEEAAPAEEAEAETAPAETEPAETAPAEAARAEGGAPAEGAGLDEARLPAAAALRRRLAEPVGPWPGPWAALSAVLEGGSRVDGAEGWTALRVHVPVASRYGAVDARLTLRWDGEGFQGIEPEIWLRALPLRLVDDGRAVFGVALGFGPFLDGEEARLTLTGGLVGGFLGDLWFARALVATQGEVIAREAPPDLVASLAAGLRLVRGQVRPQLEVDLVVPASEAAAEELALTLRPALRYWPADWIGLGLSGEALLTGPGSPSGVLRLDIVVQALE